MGKNTFWWNIPANICVRCNSLCVSLCLCLEQPLTQKATFSIKWLRVGFPWAAFTLRSSRWPVWTRSRCLQNQLLCFLSFFLTPPLSLPLFPRHSSVHTPCHSSADGRSDTWRMLGNRRDSWLSSTGALPQNIHRLSKNPVCKDPLAYAGVRVFCRISAHVHMCICNV